MLQYIQEGWQAILAGNAGQISLVGMGSVFVALTVLAVFMAALGKLFQARDAHELPATMSRLLGGSPPPAAPQLPDPGAEAAPPTAIEEEEGIPAGVLAAIATAIALDLDATSRTLARSGAPISSWRQSARRLTHRPKR